MKTWIAFLLGAALAGGVAVLTLKRDTRIEARPVQAAAAVPKAGPLFIEGPPQVAAPPQPLSLEDPSAPVEVLPPFERPKSKPKPAVRVGRPTRAQARSMPVELPASIPSTPPAPTAAPSVERQPAAEPTPQIAPPPTASSSAPTVPAEPNRVTIIGGTQISIRLAEPLSSDRVEAGQSFRATLDQPLIVDGFVIAERGALVDGRVVAADQGGRVKGTSQLSIELVRFTSSDGQRVPISTVAWVKQGEDGRTSDATKVAVGAGVGAALGAIFGGGKGAAIGAGSGAGAGTGVVLATRGKPVVLPAESRINFKLRAPVTITEKR